MSEAELTLKEFAGQRCDVVITKTGQDSFRPGGIIVRFKSERAFGHPSLWLEELEQLIKKCKALKED